jgi:hypothetical protein
MGQQAMLGIRETLRIEFKTHEIAARVEAGDGRGARPHATVKHQLAGTGVGFEVLSENLTERPLLRYFLHSLKREEPTLVTAIRLAGDAAEVGGCGGAGLRLNWAGHGQRLDEGVGVSGIPGL